MQRNQHLLAVSVNTTIDRIASARLVYQDGASSTGQFDLSSSELFVPGKELSISAGPADAANILFKGIIIQHNLKIRDNSAPTLVIECKHAASKMTINNKSACFFDQTDSDVIIQLFEASGINIEAENTDTVQKQLVQYQSSDWDFCLLRARVNGKHLLTREGQIMLSAISLDGEAEINLAFGATILDADLRIDARHQYPGVETSSWDMANQEVNLQEGEDPQFSQPGNLSTRDLAETMGLQNQSLRHPQLQEEEALSWASATWANAQASRIKGRVKCEGIGTVQPGDIVNLSGLGERFNGNAYVTAVRHDFDLVRGWKTHLQFGATEPLEKLAKPMSALPASGLLPAIHGLHIGVVTDNEDPDNEYRVRVNLPLIDSDQDGTWARVATLDAGEERGSFFRPEIGDEEVVGFLNDDPRSAIIVGMLHSSAKPAPLEGSNDNHEKVFQTRSKMKWAINDDSVEMLFETPAGNRLTLSEDQEAIVLEDQHGNAITLNQDGISLTSAKAITLAADSDIVMESGSELSASAGTQLTLEGAAGTELSSSAQTTVKGSVVQIN